jgi:tetratricopeptide (TPR) repeat protein
MAILVEKKASDTGDSPNPRLLASAREKRLVVFAGAGISMEPPTALPSWWDLSASVVRSIAARASNVISDSESAAEIIVGRQRSDSFPPDYIAEKIVYTIGQSYFEVLRCIDSDCPNINHFALAELAAAGKLRAIITTNFDRTIEAAFAARKVSLDVRADQRAAEELAAHWDAFEKGDLPCQLLKVHGTANRPETIIDTLVQRALGTPAAYLQCVQRLLAFSYWGFMGFSGADLETEHDYLGLAQGSKIGRGFTWLVQAGAKPRRGVYELVKVWGRRAEVVEGNLPGVLLDLLEGVKPLQPSEAKSTPVDLVAAAHAWSQQIDERRCALIIAELLSFCGERMRSRVALEQLAATYPQHRWKVGFGWSGETLVVKADDGSGVPPSHAMGFGDRAKPLVAGLAPTIANDAEADRINYADTLYGLSDVLDELGEEKAAADNARRSILAGLYAGGRTRIVRGLGVLADIRAKESAAEAKEDADRLYRVAIQAVPPDSLTVANLMTNRATNLLALNRQKDALDLLMQARQLFSKLGNERGRAVVELRGGELCVSIGEWHLAEVLCSTALDFARRVGDEPMRFEAAMELGRLYRARGDSAQAESSFTEALRAAEILKDTERQQQVRRAKLMQATA